jgi:hypothetical protein
MKMTLTHFEATLILAIFISAVLAVVTKKTNEERFRYGMRSLGWFAVTVFGLAWLMYLGHR